MTKVIWREDPPQEMVAIMQAPSSMEMVKRKRPCLMLMPAALAFVVEEIIGRSNSR